MMRPYVATCSLRANLVFVGILVLMAAIVIVLKD